jgi:V8-like Glu-specific endopeptidase
MNMFKKLTFWLVTLTLLCSSAPIAQAQDEANDDGTVFLPLVTTQVNGDDSAIADAQAQLVASKVISPANQKAALAFWTRERIAAAQPMALMAQTGDAEVDAAALAQAAATGPRGFSAAGAAAPDADQMAQAAYPEDWAALEALAAAVDEPAAIDGTSEVYTSYVVNKVNALWKLYPHRWVGRLSFSTPGGTSNCSATSISGNVMLTAAHCLYDSTANQWYSNWVFTPAYRNGNAPYGTFPATTCWVLTAWVNLAGGYAINTWARHDVGVCKMGTNSNGVTLNNAVGWMGRQWNWPYVRHFHNVGYPFRDSNDALITDAGKYLHACVAESFQQTTETRGMGCNRGRGISGGPWIANYAPGVVAGNADGVNSGLFIGTQNLYGARFNSDNIVVLCNAAGC